MLSDRLLRQHPEAVRAALVRRGRSDLLPVLEAWQGLESERRELVRRLEQLDGRKATAEDVATTRERLRALEREQRAQELCLPNVPAREVPEGLTERENVVLREWGTVPYWTFVPRSHVDLMERLGLLERARAAHLAGPRFPLLVGEGARLSRALANLMLDLHAAAGYIEVAPPHLLTSEALVGSAHLPAHADELYSLPRDNLLLSPTAEAQLVGMRGGELLAEADLPLRYTACTPAFRREAGSAGRATAGLLRLHQFDKVELVQVTTPEGEAEAFESMLAQAERVLQLLGLPYRVVALCAGELPFASAQTVDLEVWMPGQGRYVEISSVSVCGPFQARRLGIRYAPARRGRARHVCTLNGSALPLGRTIAALVEMGQQADGAVVLPDIVARGMGTSRLTLPDELGG